MDISELIEQLKRGEDSAGPILVSVLAPRLLGYTAMIAKDLPLADQEIAVENAIERAVVRIDQYDSSKGTFAGWVRGFVRFAVADWRRQYADGAPVELSREVARVGLTTPDSSEDGADDSPPGIEAGVSTLVLALPEVDQLLLRLRYVEVLPHNQIAEQLGITENACRKRLQRVLERLRLLAAADRDFDQYFEGDES
ncbi:MAG TPA: sigma-70 family RNA polymerase sigma factor [Acidothermaceae bacterium]